MELRRAVAAISEAIRLIETTAPPRVEPHAQPWKAASQHS